MKTKTHRGERHIKTQIGRTPDNDGGRDWNYAAARQGIPRITGQHQKLREGPRYVTNFASGKAWPCRHLEFELLASRTVRINFCCFIPSQFAIIC